MQATRPPGAPGSGIRGLASFEPRARPARGARSARPVAAAVAAALATTGGALTAAACRAPQPPESASTQAATEVEHIVPPGVSRLPVFTPAVRVGNLIFLSGAVGVKPGTLELVEGGIAAETRQTLENLRTVLQAAGADLKDAVKCTVFLADIADYAAMNQVYAEFFPENPPARSTVAGSGLALGARVEIECIAAVGTRSGT